MGARVRVRAQVLGCQSCGLRTVASKPVPFTGGNPSPIVVVGEAPGAEEDTTGRPFVGPAGRYLRKALDKVMGEGWNETVGYLNAVSCYPNRTPTYEEVVACRPNLTAQLRLFMPSYVLVVGGVALSAFWPRLRIGEMAGRWWSESDMREAGRTWLFSTVHPSAVLRSGGRTSKLGIQFEGDIGRFASVIMDAKRPGLEVDCVKCGRGERKGMGEVWERNVGVCRKHEESVFGGASSVRKRRGGGVRARVKPSVTSRPAPGSDATPGILFG